MSLIENRLIGDVYKCKEDLNNYIWNGQEWINIGQDTDYTAILEQLDLYQIETNTKIDNIESEINTTNENLNTTNQELNAKIDNLSTTTTESITNLQEENAKRSNEIQSIIEKSKLESFNYKNAEYGHNIQSRKIRKCSKYEIF